MKPQNLIVENSVLLSCNWALVSVSNKPIFDSAPEIDTVFASSITFPVTFVDISVPVFTILLSIFPIVFVVTNLMSPTFWGSVIFIFIVETPFA